MDQSPQGYWGEWWCTWPWLSKLLVIVWQHTQSKTLTNTAKGLQREKKAVAIWINEVCHAVHQQSPSALYLFSVSQMRLLSSPINTLKPLQEIENGQMFQFRGQKDDRSSGGICQSKKNQHFQVDETTDWRQNGVPSSLFHPKSNFVRRFWFPRVNMIVPDKINCVDCQAPSGMCKIQSRAE